MGDKDVTLAEPKEMVREFRDRREWGRFHTSKNLSMAVATEAAELMEQFQWLTRDEVSRLAEDPGRLELIREELADVLIYGLSLANSPEIDVASAVVNKLAKNAERYPEGEYRGMSTWLDADGGGEA
jgi:NTP pyrophosphatase (non-canonical NTP hydrolase)